MFYYFLIPDVFTSKSYVSLTRCRIDARRYATKHGVSVTIKDATGKVR
jgi:hypothetical protein